MSEKRPFMSSSIRLDGVADIVLLLGLAGTWLGMLGRWHWALDLFSHFRLQYLVLCVLAVGWTLWRKRPRLVQGLCLMSLLVNVGEIYRVTGDRAFAEVDGGRLKVVSLNVLTGNPNKKGVLDYLRSTGADVIFLMEVDAEWVEALEPLTGVYPHHLQRSQEDNFGIALFSKVPLQDVRVLLADGSHMPSVTARLTALGREMVIVGTHPLPPMGPRLSASRDAQLKSIAGYVAALDVPVLVIGDLNSTPWSHGMRLLKGGTGLDFRSSAHAWLPTWRAGSIFAIPIDHALCTPPLVIADRKIGPDVGSDHRPQELEIGWQR